MRVCSFRKYLSVTTSIHIPSSGFPFNSRLPFARPSLLLPRSSRLAITSPKQDMGVKDLWKALDPGIDPNSLRTISLEAFEKRREVRGVRLGCEAERWLLVRRFAFLQLWMILTDFALRLPAF